MQLRTLRGVYMYAGVIRVRMPYECDVRAASIIHFKNTIIYI